MKLAIEVAFMLALEATLKYGKEYRVTPSLRTKGKSCYITRKGVKDGFAVRVSDHLQQKYQKKSLYSFHPNNKDDYFVALTYLGRL